MTSLKDQNFLFFFFFDIVAVFLTLSRPSKFKPSCQKEILCKSN